MQRLGKFYMTEGFIRGATVQEVFGIMAFGPLRVELLAYNSTFECIGISHLFDPIEEGYLIPEYKIMIKEHEDPDVDELIVLTMVVENEIKE